MPQTSQGKRNLHAQQCPQTLSFTTALASCTSWVFVGSGLYETLGDQPSACGATQERNWSWSPLMIRTLIISDHSKECGKKGPQWWQHKHLKPLHRTNCGKCKKRSGKSEE